MSVKVTVIFSTKDYLYIEDFFFLLFSLSKKGIFFYVRKFSSKGRL
jgi:hypothetical protein